MMLYDEAGCCGILFRACLAHRCRIDCDTSVASQLDPTKELSRLLSLQQLPELLKTLKDCRKRSQTFITVYCSILLLLMFFIDSLDLYSGWHRLTSNLSSSFHLRMQQAKVSPRILQVFHLCMMIV